MSYLCIADSNLKLICNYTDKEMAKAIYGNWNPENKGWYYPLNYDTFLSIKQAFSDLEIHPLVLEHFKQITEEEQKALAFKHDLEIPPIINIIPLKSKLYEHQKSGVAFLLNQDTCLLCDELGVGKTLTAIVASIIRKMQGSVSRVLIICPATIKGVWAGEIEKHTYEKAVIIEGSKRQRQKQFKYYIDSKALFLVMNYESVRCDPPPFRFDYIICDESVRLKSPKAQQTKAIKRIPAKFKNALSGYPIANKIEDIHSQIDWIRPGYLGNRWHFEDRYMIKQTMIIKDHQFKQVLGYKNLKELQTRLIPLYIRRLKSEVLDLPDKIYEKREVELTTEQMGNYVRMKEEMRVVITNMNEEEYQAKARTMLVQLLRLSQITDGFMTDVTWDKPVWFKNSAKIKELDDLIEEVVESGNKVVVWSRFVLMVNALHERYKKYNAVYLTGSVPIPERTEMIKQFQTNPKVKVFIGQVQSGGMGITLHAANTEIFMDKAFISPSNIIQATDRLHRLGQKKSVVIISLIAKNTIDTHWELLLERKRQLAGQIFRDGDLMNLTKGKVLEMLE